MGRKTFPIAGSLDDNLVAGVGQPVQGTVVQDGVTKETATFLRGPVGCDDEAGEPVTAEFELMQVS